MKHWQFIHTEDLSDNNAATLSILSAGENHNLFFYTYQNEDDSRTTEIYSSVRDCLMKEYCIGYFDDTMENMRKLLVTIDALNPEASVWEIREELLKLDFVKS